MRRKILRVLTVAGIVVLSLCIPQRLFSPVKAGIGHFVFPFVSFWNKSFSAASSAGGIFSARRLRNENLVLRRRIDDLSREVQMLRELQRENDRLRSLLDFKRSHPPAPLPARVVGRDTRQWYGSVIIDRGTRDGVLPEMTVVCAGGVVGKVIECGPGFSKVLLIVDARSRIGGIFERTREMGVVEGTSFNRCRLNYLPLRPQARPGDLVISSGVGGIYPKGIPIGECIGIHEDASGLACYADISPSVNFAALEEVFVLIHRGGAYSHM